MTERADLEAAVDAADEFGGLDVIVNNGGIVGPVAPIQEIDPAEYERLRSINLDGVYTGCQVAADRLLERDAGGSIVNMSSVAGMVGYATIRRTTP